MAAMTVSASIGKSTVHCGHCRARLGDLEDGPVLAPVAERGKPFTEVMHVERELRLLEGYLPRDSDDVWTVGNHARKRLLRRQSPRFSHGDTRNGVVEFPARVECHRCSRVVIIANRP